MSRATYLCQIGCAVDCTHAHACVVGGFGGIDADHPHPSERGREHHFAYDFDRDEMHEWNGASGRCRIYTPEEDQ